MLSVPFCYPNFKIVFKTLRGALKLKRQSGSDARLHLQLGPTPRAGGMKDRGLRRRRRRSLSPSRIWPAPLCVTPDLTRQAPLILRRSSRTPLRSTRIRTSLIHAARRQNGNGREPEQPVRRGLPPRPLVTVANFNFQIEADSRTSAQLSRIAALAPGTTVHSSALLGSEFLNVTVFFSLLPPLQ